MKNKIIWILSLVLICGAVAPIEANVKKGKKELKEEKPKVVVPAPAAAKSAEGLGFTPRVGPRAQPRSRRPSE